MTERVGSKYYLAIALCGLIITTFTVSAVVSADEGESKEFAPKAHMENRGAMDQALESGDYETWKEFGGNGRIADIITADNFDRFVEAHRLAKSGDMDGAKTIFDELGISTPEGKGFGHFNGPKGIPGNEDIRAAIEANDYEAFVTAAGDLPMFKTITADNFDRFVEAHNLRQAGDFEGARDIMDELGIKGPSMGVGRGFGDCHQKLND